METRHATLRDGVTLEVLESGVGGRPLILVHGFYAAKEDFADHLDALGDIGWHAVAPDLRGHGGSDKPAEGPYGLQPFADDVVALADELGFETFALLGHSMGGMVVQLVALEHASRVEALVLMDTSHGVPDDLDPEIIELAKSVVREGGMEQFVAVSKTVPGPLASQAHERVAATRPGYDAYGDNKALACSAEMFLATIDDIVNQVDRLELLRGLEMPTLVMSGEQDATMLSHSARMDAVMPNARLVVIRDAGHSPQFESPTEWWNALRTFLDALAEPNALAG